MLEKEGYGDFAWSLLQPINHPHVVVVNYWEVKEIFTDACMIDQCLCSARTASANSGPIICEPIVQLMCVCVTLLSCLCHGHNVEEQFHICHT